MTLQNLPPLIGLTGYAGSGKDSVADILTSRYGYHRLAFADVLKKALYELNPIVEVPTKLLDVNLPMYQRYQTVVDAMGLDEAKRHIPDIRGLLQRLGTEVGRNLFGETFWADLLRPHIDDLLNQGEKVVITDVRYEHPEAQMIRDYKGVLLRITRPHQEISRTHTSESAMAEITVDAVIDNNLTLDKLPLKVAQVLDKLGDS